MRRIHIAIFSVSVGLIAFEVSLLQVLSIIQWHHFASLVISIALLGFGASGTVLSLYRRWMLSRFDRLVPLLLATCSIAIATAIPLSQIEVARFDSYLVFVQTEHAVAFLLTCFILAAPFFFGALAIGLSFVRFTDDIGRLYFWNLIGSAAGGVVALTLMSTVGPEAIAPICGLIVVAGAFALDGAMRPNGVSKVIWLAPPVCIGFAVVSPEPTISQFKDISRALDLPDAKVTYREPSPEGLVEVVAAPASRSAPGLSLHYTGEIPVRDMVFVNGDAAGMLPNDPLAADTTVYDHTTRALSYEVGPADSVLVLSSGAGETVRHALSHARYVTAIDPRRTITALWRHGHPSVRTEPVAPRTWLERDTALYDLIVFPEYGRFGGSVGLEEMQEDYLLTHEALRAAWERLGPNGRISVTAWMDYPYRVPLQVLSSLVDGVGDEVSDPRAHIAAVRSWADVTYVVSRRPFTHAVTEDVRDFSRRNGFDPLLLPDIAGTERSSFNELGDSTLFAYVDRLAGPDRGAFIAMYPFDIGPVTDDRPFAMRFLRWSGLSDVLDSFGNRAAPFFGLGLFIALRGFVIVAALSVVLIIIPLFTLGADRRGSSRTLIYFGGLGLAYFLVQIVFIQRFNLLLGHPVYAAAAVIASMLLGSGIGSRFSARLPAESRIVYRMAGFAAVTVLLYIPLLDILLDNAVSLPLGWRTTIALVLIFPPAFVMGFPFPLGLRALSTTRFSQVPWAWGINGCLSVVGAAGASLLAVEFGFTAVLIMAAGSYGLAALAMR